MLEPTIPSNSSSIDVGWASFNGPEGPHRLDELDLAFLSSYAIRVYFAGHVGDRIDLRLFLVFGMMVVALSPCFSGLPCVVAIAGNWFGKEKRGLIMELWILMVWVIPRTEIEMNAESEEARLLESQVSVVPGPSTAIRFLEARRLPGVVPFALCLFFSKPVAYTLAVGGIHLSRKTAGIISTISDIGGLFTGSWLVSIQISSKLVLVTLVTFDSCTRLVPAVAANLGTQDMIKGNSRTLATVTAIIDGTGSVGRALGPLLAGYISTRGWNSVLLVAIFLASLFLIHVAKTKVERMVNERKGRCSSVRGN
ncbi:hypothetical protein Gorai_003610 [Gossypium raimondii]|uniref:Major facilitator superfamily (MFS) profile domain-containing protein n=1 Tax=Gossypium raimondii TaxID=29730 RepID=A0A7J8QPG3_GOSRA|nr:hypothetical protein [Gossypium raimondii]